MTDRLAFLIWRAAPDAPAFAVTPLVHALAARALDAEVELHFAGPAVRWLVEGVADSAWPDGHSEKSMGAFLREAMAEGVAVYACGMARNAWIQPDEKLLAGVRHAGATSFVARTLDPAWRSLVY